MTRSARRYLLTLMLALLGAALSVAVGSALAGAEVAPVAIGLPSALLLALVARLALFARKG